MVKNALYNVGPKNMLENPTFLIHDLPDVSPVQYIGGKGLTWSVILTQLSASLAFGAPLMHQGSLLKITPGWAAGVPHEQTQVYLLTLPNVWGLFRLGVKGFLVTPLRHICVMLWAWAPKSALGSYKRLRSSLTSGGCFTNYQALGCKCVARLSILTQDKSYMTALSTDLNTTHLDISCFHDLEDWLISTVFFTFLPPIQVSSVWHIMSHHFFIIHKPQSEIPF